MQATESRLPVAEGKVQYPLELETPYGTTILEERPERIAVATTTSDAENLIALGVDPVMLIDSYRDKSWITDREAIDSVEVWAPTPGSGSEDFPFEALAASKPDLIIAAHTSALEQQWDRVSAIAPVLGGDNPSSDLTWEESLTLIAEALDLEDKAQEIIVANERVVDSALDETPELRGRSLAVLMAHPTAGIQYRSPDPGSASEFIQALGFTVAPFSRNSAFANSLSISPEQYAEIDADILLVFASPEEQEKFMSEPVFQTIPAVREGDYAFIDQATFAYATLWPTALSVPYVVEEALKPAFQEIDHG